MTTTSSLSPSIEQTLDAIAALRPEREAEERLPFEAIDLVRQAGLGALRVPAELGGAGVGSRELFAFLIDLAEADADAAHALRAHYAFVEMMLTSGDAEARERWLGLVADRAILGCAMTELNGNAVDGLTYETKVSGAADDLRLDGTKYFSTGAIFADHIWVSAGGTDGETLQVVVPNAREGVTTVDDWDGFGQRFTGSGTTVFENVHLEPNEVSVTARPGEDRPRSHIDSVFQLYLWAVVAGILRVTVADAAELMRGRKRSYAYAPTPLPADDPLLAQFVGEIAASAFALEAMVLETAPLLDRVVASYVDGRGDPDVIQELTLRVAMVQVHGSEIASRAATRVFDVGGASATRRGAALDRHWRNVRTITSHNPAVYKATGVGAHLVNGTELPNGAYW
jgi:alkylation response protein AidB-like acyl-CoA dehydrogenase